MFFSFQICHHKKLCFSMHSRKDPTEIGTDEFGNSVLNYYECKNGYCSEIYNLTCERRCNEKSVALLCSCLKRVFFFKLFGPLFVPRRPGRSRPRASTR